MNAFYVMGAVLTLWAVLLSAVGIARHGFPFRPAGGAVVMAISVLLAAAAIGSAIVTASQEDAEGEEAAREGGAAGEVLGLSADPGGDLAFDTDSLNAKAGEVTIEMENPSQLQHDVSIEGKDLDEQGETVGQGGTSTVSAKLEPGTYVFYCSVTGHREGGMEGELTVD